jgi:phosphoserine phosphatase
MIVVADLVGTLTTGSPVMGLVSWVRHHQSRLRADLYLASALPVFLLARWGLLNYQRAGGAAMIQCLPLLREATPERVCEMAEWSVEHVLWPRRRPEVLARLARHLQAGASVTIASSAYLPTVEAFARRIGAQAIGTPLQITRARLSLAADLLAEEHKAEAVLAQLGVAQVDVAYGDTWQDIPLLERAARPVAVHPDRVLAQVASERGWEVLDGR